MKYEVARQALAAGAVILNDQWGLKKEPRLAQLAAEKGVPLILMSNQRDKGGYDTKVGRDTGFYQDVMAEVIAFLRGSIETAHKAGVPKENIIIDPGIGFGKMWQQDIEIIRRLQELKALGQPILIGTSRKSLIKMVLDLPAAERIEGTAATVAIGIANGADIVRVHDVKQMVRVCKMADAIVRGVS
jgi:dihydropteroate synthase